MAGGSGERFWPVSRNAHPKQLLRLADPDRTLLEQARDRIEPLVGPRRVFIAVGKSVENPVRDADLVAQANVLVEPAKRNTFGCLCWAAANLIARDMHESTLGIVTADHLIEDEDAFRDCVARAMQVAEETEGLVTIGIQPTRAETGYGYIEQGAPVPGGFRVKSFREKPDAETAQKFVDQGGFFWNSGMFFYKLGAFLKALSLVQPEAERLTAQMANAIQRGELDTAIQKFEELPNMSVDYALMEKAPEVYMVPSTFGWDDIGSWDALERTFPKDDAGNVVIGDAELVDSEGCIIYNVSSQALVGLYGLKDMVVVATDDAMLALPKDKAQSVRDIVARLKEKGRTEL